MGCCWGWLGLGVVLGGLVSGLVWACSVCLVEWGTAMHTAVVVLVSVVSARNGELGDVHSPLGRQRLMCIGARATANTTAVAVLASAAAARKKEVAVAASAVVQTAVGALVA